MKPLALLAAAVLAPMLAVSLYNLATAPRLHRIRRAASRRRVSVLVPARDEEANLRQLLPQLLRQQGVELEVLVLDDHSADATAEVAAAHARSDPRLRLLAGAPLPPGWLGKNWACHQLAGAARGDLLLFCDADVEAGPHAVARTLSLMAAEGAGAATALPRQRLRGWGVGAVVPLVAQLPVSALLPLRLVARARSPALSMANGQWLAFTREAYARCGGHAAVRAEVLEDVALGRRVKEQGHRLVAAVAPRDLGVRMYADLAEARAGFGKNLYALLGARPAPFALAVALFSLAAVYPWAAVAAGETDALPALGLLAGVRLAGAALFGHDLRTVLLHPAGSLLLLEIGARSALGHRRGTLRWKGRALARPQG